MAETTKKPNHESHDSHSQISFERRDVNIFQISAFGIGLLISTIVVIFAMWALFAFLVKREDAKNPPSTPMAMEHAHSLPPEPRLSGVRVEDGKRLSPVYPKVQMEELTRDEDAILNNYGWVDPNAGTVRIPIAQAMDMVVKKRLPSKPTPAGLDHDGYRTIPSVASSGQMLEKIAQ